MVRAQRVLSWGTPVFGLVVLSIAMVAEELIGLSLLFGSRGPVAPPDDVVVVGIDESTEDALDAPLSRSLHAALVEELTAAGASVIVFDIFLDAESDDDALLAAALRSAGNVILIGRLARDRPGGMDRQVLRVPAPALAESALGSASWVVPQVFRVDWAFLRDDADRPTIPLLALHVHTYEPLLRALRASRPELARRLPSTTGELADQGLERALDELRHAFTGDPSLGADVLAFGGTYAAAFRSLVAMHSSAPMYRANRVYLNYYGPPRTIHTVPYQDALAGAFGRGAASVAGKAVFVGYSARSQPGQRDHYPYVYSQDGFNLSGVEMSATAFGNLLDGTYIEQPPRPIRAGIVVLWGLIIAACFRTLRVRPGMAASLLLLTGYLAIALTAFSYDNLWLPIVTPALQLMFAGTLSVRVKQLTERARLGVGTSEEAVLALTGRSKPEKLDHRIVLFADEQGSKKRVRRETATLDLAQRRALHHDMALARDVPIVLHGGQINHTLADSMLAHWITRDPSNLTAVAAQVTAACRAALTIHDRFGELDRKYPGFHLALRIGIDWGEITSQLNPSPEIKDWRMEGAAIHAAERLESLNKLLETSTLISHAVALHLDPAEFHCVELGTFVFCDETGDVVVDPIRVHALRAAAVVEDDESQQAAEFCAALEAARRHDYHSARERFAMLACAAGRHARLAARYAEWCDQTLLERDGRWDGAVRVTFSDKSQYLERFVAVAPTHRTEGCVDETAADR